MKGLDPDVLDIAGSFGPLASMHAALDRAGAGMPCGVIAKFDGRTCGEVEMALRAAAASFPILSRRLIWRNSRPVLERATEGLPAPLGIETGVNAPPLAFSVGPDGRFWRYQLCQTEDGTLLFMIFAHAAADGISMLRLLSAVEAALLGGRPDPAFAFPPRARPKPASFAAWLPPFLADRFLGRFVVAQKSRSTLGISWIRTTAGERDRLLAFARGDRGGFGSQLAAASAIGFCRQQNGAKGGAVALNLPVGARNLETLGGFGFGVGSLLFRVRLQPDDDVSTVSRRIVKRRQKMADAGWDQGLDRLLGPNPGRHARFAAIRSGFPPDPTLVISWKGKFNSIGHDGGARQVMCFAEAPTAHVSGHADNAGLSISLTAHQSREERSALLSAIANLLGIATPPNLFHLEDLMAGPADQRPQARKVWLEVGEAGDLAKKMHL